MPGLVIAALPVVASALGVAGSELIAITAFSMVASYALQRSQMPGAPDPQVITRNIKSPVSPRRIIYGKRRVGGTIVYASTTDDDNYLHMMIALAGHEVKSISDIYMNDKKLEEYDNKGSKQKAYIKWDGGVGVDQDSFSVTVVGSGVYSGTIQEIIDALKVDGYDAAGAYQEYRADREDDTLSWRAHLSIKPPKVDDIITVTDTGGDVSYSSPGSTVLYRVNTHLGSSTQTADADAVTEIPEWTVDHKLSGIAYVYVRIRYERESFPTGVPNITALVEGKQDIYDPRDGGSYGYTNNAALCAADYLHSGMFGFGAEYVTDIDTTALIAAANACDESITLTDASNEPRYTCNGVIDTSQTPKENLANLLTSMVGSCVFVGGKWKFYAGVYRTPQMNFDENDLRDGLTIQTKRSRSNICNGVKGTYIYANDDESSYQPADFPSVTNALYKSEDGDVDIWKDLALAYTTSASMAQRIAKIELEKARQGITFKFPAKLTALNTTTGDVVNISNDRLGWTNKPFEIVDWEFAIADSGELGIDLTLQETASGIYDWANGEETTTDLAKNTNLPNPGYVAPVTNLQTVETAVVNIAGDEVVNIKVTWDASASNQTDYYEIEFVASNPTSDEDWSSATTSGTNYQIDGVASGDAYFVRVRAVNVYGAKSQWETTGFYSGGVTATPLAPDSLSLVPTVDMLTATWGYPVEADSSFRAGTDFFVSLTNDRSLAFLVDTAPGNTFSYPVTGGNEIWTWVRARGKNGKVSEFFPTSAVDGIYGQAASATLSMDDLIGKVNNIHLHEELSSRIDLIDTNMVFDDGVHETEQFTGLNGAFTSFYGSNKDLTVQSNTLTSNVNTLDSNVNTLDSNVNDLGTRADGTDSDIADLNSAIQTKASITQLDATNGNVDGILAQYTIKLDVNGKVSGIGLMNDGATSGVEVYADQFYIIDEEHPTVTQSPPFAVVNGVVYLNTAIVKAGSFNALHIEGDAITAAGSSIRSLAEAPLTVNLAVSGGSFGLSILLNSTVLVNNGYGNPSTFDFRLFKKVNAGAYSEAIGLWLYSYTLQTYVYKDYIPAGSINTYKIECSQHNTSTLVPGGYASLVYFAARR